MKMKLIKKIPLEQEVDLLKLMPNLFGLFGVNQLLYFPLKISRILSVKSILFSVDLPSMMLKNSSHSLLMAFMRTLIEFNLKNKSKWKKL